MKIMCCKFFPSTPDVDDHKYLSSFEDSNCVTYQFILVVHYTEYDMMVTTAAKATTFIKYPYKNLIIKMHH